jgi:hypothetical protein
MHKNLYNSNLIDRIRKQIGLVKDSNRYSDKIRPEIFREDYSLLNLVHTSEASVSDYRSIRPVLATVGIGPCVAMAGYDSKNKLGFVSHNCVGDYVDELHDKVLEELRRLTPNLTMDIYIVGGMSGSGELASKLRNYAKRKLNPKSINEDLALRVSSCDYLGKSFVLDTRNGKVYSIEGGGKLQYVPSAEPRISLRTK